MSSKRHLGLVSSLLKGVSKLIQLESADGRPLSEGGATVRRAGRHKVEYQSDLLYLRSDPRPHFLKRILELSLSSLGTPASTSFRFKRLSDWLVAMPISTFMSQFSWDCASNCTFCYQKGNPPRLRVKQRLSLAETATRLKYYNGEKALVCGNVFENDETLNNPWIERIFREVRKKNRDLVDLFTNGTALTPKMIRLLKTCGPVFVRLSLNTIDQTLRRRLIREKNPKIVMRAPARLKRAKIPFSISIVAWPGISFADMKKTILFAEENGAYAATVYIPGWSRYNAPNKAIDYRKLVKTIATDVEALNRSFGLPIMISPYDYSMEWSFVRSDTPFVVGTISNSPARRSGIRYGDILRRVDGKGMTSTLSSIEALRRRLHGSVSVAVERNGRTIDFILKDKTCYPYSSEEVTAEAPFGIYLNSYYHGITKLDALDIERYSKIHSVRKLLILTSALAHAALRESIEKHAFRRGDAPEIRYGLVDNAFYGGCIEGMDMAVVSDMIQCIRRSTRRYRPDLILIPFSPFSAWGRDFLGRVNLDIERATGFAVEFIYNKSFKRERL